MIKPGLFSKTVAADSRRQEFDIKNEQLLALARSIDAVFIGDSITNFWELNAYMGRNRLLINRGIGGDTSEYVAIRLDADAIQLKPDMLFVMVGTNDFFHAHDDLWWKNPGLPCDCVLEKYRRNIDDICVKSANAGISLFLCSVLPSTIAPPYSREKCWYMTENMNSYLRDKCTYIERTYVDYHSALCESDGRNIRSEFTIDGIHPNAKAYAILSEIAKKQMSSRR